MRPIQKGCLSVGVALATGCGSSDGRSSPQSIYGTWEYIGSTADQGLTLNPDGTYAHEKLEAVTATSFDAEIDRGTFTLAADGYTMSLTPTEWTCSGAAPPYLATYALTGSTLVFTQGSNILEFALDTQSPNTASGVAIAEGCFTSTGFVQRALAPVSP
jgi:hypothetical protein